VIFHNRMRRYDCLTADPSSATAMYVPFYPAMEIQPHICGFNSSVRNGAPLAFLRWLSSQPTWPTMGGRDHFLVASKTSWVFRAVGGPDIRCGNSFLEQPESRNMTVLTYESNIWVDTRWDFAVPYPSYFHPSSAGEVAAWQARVRGSPRPHLFAFAGARRPNGSLAIRDRIFDACDASRGRCGLLDCRHGCGSPQKLVALFASASFCLQPPGDSFMRRSSVDAVISGCVPVFFREASTFEKQYIWHVPDASNGERRSPHFVLIDHDEVLAGKVDIEDTLSRYTDAEVAAMREEVITMIPRFIYKDPRVRFQGDMKDGFDVAMDALMDRMRRIKNGEDVGWKGDDDGEAVLANNDGS
jgi:xyloglucan galactosyltransferase MUR3